MTEVNPRHNNSAVRRNYLPLLWLMGVALLLAVAGLIWQNGLFAAQEPEKKAGASPAMPAVTVEVAKVRTQTAVHEITAVGTLEANESVIIRSEVSGRITDIGFEEGTRVKKDQPLFTLDQSELKAELDKAKADLNLHYADYIRAKKLLKSNAIAKRERDQAYALWRSDQASVRLIKARLDKTVIKAPFDGTLGLRQVSLGDYIVAGQDLVNIEDMSKLKIAFKVPEVHAHLVAPGQALHLSADAVEQEFDARVYAINPRMDAQSRSLKVKAILDNPRGRLHPGQFARLALAVGQSENALFVPEQAILSEPERDFVWTVQEDRAVKKEVRLGVRERGMAEITSGLGPEDLVITGGTQKIGPNAPVKPVMADPELFKTQTDSAA